MTNALWEDLHGWDKVQAALTSKNAKRRRSRSDPNRRRDGESEERYTHRLAVQAQQEFLRNQRGSFYLPDVEAA